jgi:hypothetical protein
MVKRRIRGKIVVQQERTLVVHPAQDPVLQWCSRCGRWVEMTIPEEAARRCGVSFRSMYRRIESGEVHFLELAEGTILVCLNSIETQKGS